MTKSLKDIETVEKWLEAFYPIGKQDKGVSRLGYSYEEDCMHDMLRSIARDEDFKVKIDSVGNSFVMLDEDKSENFTLIGSHLDSVPQGGRFDGVAGVVAGLLILKWIKEESLNIPIKIAAFRCEESSAFGKATIGSSLATGQINKKEMINLKNHKAQSLYDILKSKGYCTCGYKIKGVENFIELHIEQGRILWEENCDIGIVTSIAAPKRFMINIEGRQDHSGATPMNMRKDALCAAAEIILSLEDIGKKELNHSTVATVGILENFPNVMNVVSGNVKLGVDIRGKDKESINRVVEKFQKKIDLICKKRGLKYKVKLISSSEPKKLDQKHIEGLSNKAKELNLSYISLPSGAGHDAVNFVDIAKTVMVFIPCKEGISHNPKEYAKTSHIVKGAHLIFEYLKEVYRCS